MSTPATVIPYCPTCGLPAQTDIVQAFRDLRTRIEDIDHKLLRACVEARHWKALAETLEQQLRPEEEGVTYDERIARASRQHQLEPVHA